MQSWCSGLRLGIWLVVWSAIAFSGNRALGQIKGDRTLPNNSRVTTQDNIKTIEGGTQAGSNLFHSFQEFSVPNGIEAHFHNAADIQNIISRVTGKSGSDIDGLIKANGTANLFLINPNGIIFGRDAKLDISGSFIASTANAIQFGNQGVFSATNPDNSSSLLTVNPSALLFNQIAAASIKNNSANLKVKDGQGLFLVGGNISLDGGRLDAFGGRVELGGLAGAGTVGLNGDGKNLSLSFPEGVPRSDVSLTNGAAVNVIADNDGSIGISARNVELADESYLLAGIAPDLGSLNSRAGNIEVNAQGTVNLKDRSRIDNIVLQKATGYAGDVMIKTGSLSLSDSAQIGACTRGRGDAGNVIITASDTVSFDGVNNGIRSGIFSTVEPGAKGNGGDVMIKTGSFSLTNGAQLLALTRGRGDAGNVAITARDTVSFDNAVSGVFSGVESRAVGKGGEINITTDSLSLTNSAQVNASSAGRGSAGNIKVRSRSIQLDNKADILARTTSGKGGNINLGVRGLLSLRRNSRISTNAGTEKAGGDGGNITIDAPKSFIVAAPNENSDITANAFGGQGGKVEINTTGIFGLEKRSRAELERRLGTNDPEKLDPSKLPTNDITAISQTSPNLSGEVNIKTPDVDPSSGLNELATDVVDASQQIDTSCQPRSRQSRSSYVETGRGGLPPNPREVLRSNPVRVDWVTLPQSSHNRNSRQTQQKTEPQPIVPSSIVEAQAWVVDTQGKVTLVAEAPSASPHSPGFSPASCPAR